MGWGLLKLTTGLRPDLFPQGAAIGFWTWPSREFAPSGGAGGVRPPRLPSNASQAARRDGPAGGDDPFHFPRLATLFGIALVTVNPILLFYVPMSDSARVMASSAVGFTSMGLGFILLAPAMILITENWLAPVVCRLFATDPRLLATRLTSNLWRTFGTTIALTLGLGLFIAMQTWGYSMLAPFMPGDWVPDAVAVMTPTGIPATEVDAVLAIKGIDARRSLPCIAEQTKFASDVTGAEIRATTARQDNCIMAGVDPDRALGGDRPVFNFPFVHGTREDAIAKLKRGRFASYRTHSNARAA